MMTANDPFECRVQGQKRDAEVAIRITALVLLLVRRDSNIEASQLGSVAVGCSDTMKEWERKPRLGFLGHFQLVAPPTTSL